MRSFLIFIVFVWLGTVVFAPEGKENPGCNAVNKKPGVYLPEKLKNRWDGYRRPWSLK